MDYCSICSEFNINLEFRTLEQIKKLYLTELIFKYKDFDTVLQHAGNMHYDAELIAWVCGIPEQEVPRKLLEEEIIGVLEHFDHWETEETKEQYIDLYNAYEQCLYSQAKTKGI